MDQGHECRPFRRGLNLNNGRSLEQQEAAQFYLLAQLGQLQ